ncbi:MAG: spondin domain-containing protein [FCB group bacterium]|nr:spondin domain-containing protein [FCB group bacterium]
MKKELIMIGRFVIAVTILLFAIGCDNNSSTEPANPSMFQVTIENIAPDYDYSASGIFNTPAGAAEPGPIFPGDAYEFSFDAAPGSRLSFATMFVQSNDLFYAPDEAGIALFDNMGNQITGDVTSQVYLWDAGTEINQEPGLGADQAPHQGAADTGAADPNMNVRLAADTFGNLPENDVVIEVTITSTSATGFHVRIENVSDGSTLMTSDGATHAVPMAPGVWVVHSTDGPLFNAGMSDRGAGLEAIAEDGDPGSLGTLLDSMSGVFQIIAPGVWAVHDGSNPLFVDGLADMGEGLEDLAEDGSPGALDAALMAKASVMYNGVFNTPDGASAPGPVVPGSSYSFEFEAVDGYLSFATMLVQSNDLFLAPGTMGIQLFDNSGDAISGDITNMIYLWDAGTEVNEIPGVGLNQAPRQSGADTGMDEGGVVEMVNDGFVYPAITDIIRVTITGM